MSETTIVESYCSRCGLRLSFQQFYVGGVGPLCGKCAGTESGGMDYQRGFNDGYEAGKKAAQAWRTALAQEKPG